MEQLISSYLSYSLQDYTILAIFLVFVGGIITSIGPCNISMIPLLMAYVGGSNSDRSRSFWLSVFFTLGTSTTFALLGIAVSLVGGIFGVSRSLLNYIAAAVSIAVGLKMINAIDFSLPNLGSRILHKPRHHGLGAAFLLGLTIGLAGSQCGTPVLFAILSLVMSKGQILFGAILLFIYGLGRGIPVIIAGTFTGVAKGFPSLARWAELFEKIAGSVLILVGLYFIWTA